jgi:acylphosphatase
VEGTPGLIEEFIGEVRKGPPMAHVERLEIHDIAVSGRYRTFMIEGW